MRFIRPGRLFHGESLPVVANDDLMAVWKQICDDVDLAFRCSSDPVADRVFHHGLNSQCRQKEVLVVDFIVHMDIGESLHFDLGLYQSVIQFLSEGNQIFFIQRINVLSQIGCEFLCNGGCFFGILQAKCLDGGKSIIEEVGLNLRKHDLDSLL